MLEPKFEFVYMGPVFSFQLLGSEAELYTVLVYAGFECKLTWEKSFNPVTVQGDGHMSYLGRKSTYY